MSTQIVSANRLRDGAVVFWTRDDQWSTDLSAAAPFLAQSPEISAALATATRQTTEVVGVYTVDVSATDSGLRPQTTRERIRVSGPTIDFLPR